MRRSLIGRHAPVIAMLMLFLSSLAIAESNSSIATRAVAELSSTSPGSVERGLGLVDRLDGPLGDSLARLLVAMLQSEGSLARSTPYGPVTQETRLTRILLLHQSEVMPLLIAALEDASWNSRRHAALIIGLTCERRHATLLREELQREIRRVEHRRLEVRGQSVYVFSALFSMFEAFVRIDHEQALDSAIAMFEDDKVSFQNFATNQMLSHVTHGSPETCVGMRGPDAWRDCKEEWSAWRRRAGASFSVTFCDNR